jgi:DNA (cytosine-5)-methyltransferase 1
MKSKNPSSGCREVNTANALDTSTQCPSKNQGGIAVVTAKAQKAHSAVAALDCRNLCENSELSATLQAKNGGGYSLNYQNPVRTGYIVRRLTPTECERLMAFPDDWTKRGHDGRLLSDSARYQLLGNSIVVNVLAYIMQNIAEALHSRKRYPHGEDETPDTIFFDNLQFIKQQGSEQPCYLHTI